MYINTFTGLEKFHICHRYFSCVLTTPSKSSKASQALIINAERPSCQRLIKSSNQTFASLPNCCSQESSRTLTCGSFHPDTHTGLGFRWSSVVHVFVALRVFGK